MSAEPIRDPVERERLRVLHDYGVLDTPEDPVFDDITSIAAMICQTPISLISLVDENRQWFKSHHGLKERELPRQISFCTHTIRSPDRLMVVGDARKDARFIDNPLVHASKPILFYAGAPLLTPDGFALGTVCVADHSPRVLSEEQLGALRSLARFAMSQLELRRALRAEREIQEQYLRAQRLECLGALAGGIAHDLNNVLTPILVSINLLQRRCEEDPPARETLQLIEASAQRGANLIRQVLSFSRGAEGTTTPINIGTVLNEVVPLAKKAFPPSISLNVSVPADVWMLRADATHLHQIFMNLLVNAKDAMPTGGSIEVTARNTEILGSEAAVFGKKAGPFVAISVRDTGVGMSTDILDRIFEPFFTTKKHGVGTGLGLSTAYGIVKNYGGFIRVSSEVGKGSTFEVCLPALPREAPRPTRPETKLPRGNGEVVLLVDDEFAIRTVAAQTLQFFGYRVLPAENGDEALKLFEEHGSEIRLVVTDMTMPIMDGATLVARLHALRADLPVIVASGGSQPPGNERLPGEPTRLAKPYTASSLLETVRKTLDQQIQKPAQE